MIQKIYFHLLLLTIITACNSAETKIDLETPILIKNQIVFNPELIKKDIFGRDTLGQTCHIQIYNDNQGVLIVSGRGWENQHFGTFDYDSLNHYYEFSPSKTFSSEKCKSHHWGEPFVVINGNGTFEDIDITTRVFNDNFDSSFVLKDTLIVLDLSNSYLNNFTEITVVFDFPEYSRFNSKSWTFEYFYTGLCTTNGRFFDSSKIQITSDEITIYNLYESHHLFKDKIEHYKIEK